MSSESSRRRSVRAGIAGTAALAGVAAVAALGLLAAACGKKGDPRPAPRTIPQAIGDLAVRQRGFEVVLEMTHPKSTVAGLAFDGLDEVVLYELERPAATGAAATPAAVAPPDRREFELAAKPTLRIGGAELASAISGDRITLRFRLPEPLPAPAPQRFYAVRTHALAGEASELSNLVALLPRDVPAPPESFRVTGRKDGIELSWAADGAALAGHNLYRRLATETGYGPALAELAATSTGTIDRAAVYGQRYIYAATAVAGRAPLVESALSVEREIAYDDRYAPETPVGLAALPGAGEIRLVWEPVSEPDVAGYVVERAEPGNDFHRVTQSPVTSPEHVDRGLASGFDFRYRVAAIDRVGNLGAFSPPVEARVP
jgi:hypothetical protein